MTTPLIVVLVVAAIASIPGIIALIDQFRRR